jgi:tight adherence protein C
MNTYVSAALVALGMLSGGVAGGSLLGIAVAKGVSSARKRKAIEHQMQIADVDAAGDPDARGREGDVLSRAWREPATHRDHSLTLLGYAHRVSQGLVYGNTPAFSLTVRLGRASDTRAAAFLREHAAKAGLRSGVSDAGFVEARFRITALAVVCGAAFGVIVSNEMALLLAALGAALGWRALSQSLVKLEKHRAIGVEGRVSEMLDVVALGLRSGLTFDRSFEMYGTHFHSEFALECASACKSWSLGLTTREEALRSLASSYSCEELSRAVESTIRSLRFGGSFADDLEDLAAQTRANHRAAVGERVAKAPVKMMLPTGTLILPAMLLLVLGPVLLELVQGF